MACPKPCARQRLASYDDAALEADVIAARQALVAAVTADPVVKVAAAVIAAQVRRTKAAAWARNAAARFDGVPSPVTSTPPALVRQRARGRQSCHR